MKTLMKGSACLRYRIPKYAIALLFILLIHEKVDAQKSYVTLTTSGYCASSPYNYYMSWYNPWTYISSPTGVFVFDGPLSSGVYYNPGVNIICGTDNANLGYTGGFTIPDPETELFTADSWVGDYWVEYIHIKYCYEPPLPTVTVTKDGACETENFVVSIANPYTWFDLWVSDETLVWKKIKHVNGITTTVTQAEMLSLFPTIYNKTFYFRTEVRGCQGNRFSERTNGQSYKAPAPNVSLVTSTNVLCNGGSTGTVTLQISNTLSAVNNFRINCLHENPFNNFDVQGISSGTFQIQNLKAGNWQFQVVNNFDPDNYGACSTTISQSISQPSVLQVNFITQLHNGYAISCKGGSNGSTTAVGVGGVGNYKDFDWGSGVGSATLSGVPAGTYTVTIKDGNNCVATNSVILQEPPAAVQATAVRGSNYNGYGVQCLNSSNGIMSVTPAGGVSAYTYLWSTGAASNTISGLSANVLYSVTVTDGNGCSGSSSLTLLAPPPIDFAISQTAGLSCPGDATAILQATPVLSTIIGSAHYSWSTGDNSSSISNVAAGTYSVTVTDDQTCSTMKSITLNDPPAHTVTLAPTSDFNGARIKCNGEANGVLTATVRNASNAIVTAQNYEWFKGATSLGSSPSLSSLTALNEGQYKVVITYGTGCTAENQYLLNDPDPIISSISPTTNYNGQPISCYNMTDANLRVTSSGGTGAHTYSWNTGASGFLLTGVGAGSYTANVTDVNGCPATSNYTLNNPTQVVASIASVSNFAGFGVSCAASNNGQITAEGSGGTGVYSYSWNNGKNTALNNNLTPGLYTVTVTDNNGCSNSIQQNITAPPALTFSVTDKKDVSCYGGNDGYIKLLPGGGVGSFQYSRDGTNWQGSDTFNNLTQGAYTLRLRDGNGCTLNTSSTITQPTQINISFADIIGATCNTPGGTARAVVSGGTGAYTYEWKDALLNIVDNDNILSSVGGGIYTVSVKDANLCLMTGNVSITSVDGAQASYSTTATKCFDSSDGSALISITSGVGPFVITWPDGQNTLQGINLRKEQYDVLITDANNCTVVKTINVPGPNPLELMVQSSTPPTCNSLCDGEITLNASGGVGGYSYSWNNTTGATQTALCAGVYGVILKDANNCVFNKDVTLTQPDPITVAVDQYTIPSCKDGCDGTMRIIASGGNGNYTYSWMSGGNMNALTNICSGEYVVTVTDQLGCDNELTVELPNAPDLPIHLGGGATVCVGQSYILQAGNQWQHINWGSTTGFTSTQSNITINEPGTYWVEVLNALGCVGQDTFLLETSLDLLNASFLMSGETKANDTIVMIDISWPFPEQIVWSFPEQMQMVDDRGDVVMAKFEEAGVYQITLTAHLGECLGSTTKTLTVLEQEEGDDNGRLGYEKYVKQFNISPNPNDGKFQVNVELAEAGPVTLSVWHTSGILMKTYRQQGSNIYDPFLDLQSLTPGNYILKLDHSKGKKYIRFIVY